MLVIKSNNSTIGAFTLTGIGRKPIDYGNGLISDLFCKCLGTMITYLPLLIVSLPTLKLNVEICQSHSFLSSIFLIASTELCL